ncbi:hypothetical protein KY358_06520 [Candidatus Woesearchaeota archaeon]|nr:hypothetical protein [Candidatus Woesearchaeota archaeon]
MKNKKPLKSAEHTITYSVTTNDKADNWAIVEGVSRNKKNHIPMDILVGIICTILLLASGGFEADGFMLLTAAILTAAVMSIVFIYSWIKTKEAR